MYRLLALALAACLMPPPAAAQQIPPVGAAETLDVATWNIEWFGNAANGPADDARQRNNVVAVIRAAGIDLWAVQEISDVADFGLLLEALGDGFDGVLATETSGLRTGFVYRTDVFENIVVRHLLTDFDRAFAGRPPLELTADAVLPDSTLRLSFIVLHMKAFADQASYERRVEASQRLKNHLDLLRPAEPILVLGDFNDALTGSIRNGQPSPYQNFLDDADDYFFPSLSIEAAGLGTFCGSNQRCEGFSTIDHILATDELAAAYVPGSAARFEALLDVFDGTGGACNGEYVCTTSDHLPVFARFRFDTSVGVARADVPAGFEMQLSPNPFHGRATLGLTLPRAARLRADVFDVRGRRVATLADGLHAAGRHRLPFDAAGLPAGLYVVRLALDGAVHVRTALHLRP